MATQLKEGDLVRIADREPTPADEKSGTFYAYFRNATGTLEKIYSDEMASVVVEVESLPEEVRTRHETLTDAAKQKWLGGLSDEARNRLTPEEREFQMRYTVLVNLSDLTKKAARTPAVAAKPAGTGETKSVPPVVSTTDLDKAEEEALKARQSQKGT